MQGGGHGNTSINDIIKGMVDYITSTHDVALIPEIGAVVKSSAPDNPNYRNFAIEQAIWRELGGCQFPNEHTIVMDYFGPAGTFDMSHVPLIKAALDDLNDALADKAGDIGLVPLANPNRDAIVAERCGGTVFEATYLAAREMVIDLPKDTVTHSDLQPDNYAVDERGELHLFDFESAELAPHSAAWSALVVNLWMAQHPQASDVIDLCLWSPECLTFKAALSATHTVWKQGTQAGQDQVTKLDDLARQCGTPLISSLAD